MTPLQQTAETGDLTGQTGLMANVVALERFQVGIRTLLGTDDVLDMTLKHLNSLWPFKVSGFFLPNEHFEFLPATPLPKPEGDILMEQVEQAMDSGTFGWVMKHVRPASFKSGREKEQLILGAVRTRRRVIGMFAALLDWDPVHQRDACAPFLAIYLSSVADAILSEQLTRELQDHNRHLDEMVRQRTRQLETAKEAAELASRSKDMFLATISHELRTPLNAILGFSQNLRSGGALDFKEQEQVGVIYSSADHLLSMINDLLELALPDTTRIELAPGPLDIRDLVRDVASAIKSRAEEKRLSVQFVVAPEVPASLNSDKKRLRQILLNLLSNAVKFTEKGSIALRVFRVDGSIRFSVEDSGCGIPEELLPGLFRPFQQLESSLKRGEGGGFGLAISRNIATALGTEIKVSSDVGKGSVFWFDLEAPHEETPEEVCVIDLQAESGERLDLPDDRIRRFRELVEEGDIMTLQGELEAWMVQLPAPNPSAIRLHEFASGFRIKALRKMLNMSD